MKPNKWVKEMFQGVCCILHSSIISFKHSRSNWNIKFFDTLKWLEMLFMLFLQSTKVVVIWNILLEYLIFILEKNFYYSFLIYRCVTTYLRQILFTYRITSHKILHWRICHVVILFKRTLWNDRHPDKYFNKASCIQFLLIFKNS